MALGLDLPPAMKWGVEGHSMLQLGCFSLNQALNCIIDAFSNATFSHIKVSANSVLLVNSCQTVA